MLLSSSSSMRPARPGPRPVVSKPFGCSLLHAAHSPSPSTHYHYCCSRNRSAFALHAACCFYSPDNLKLLDAADGQLVHFSPFIYPKLPPGNSIFFFLNDPAPPETSPLPLHDALPI